MSRTFNRPAGVKKLMENQVYFAENPHILEAASDEEIQSWCLGTKVSRKKGTTMAAEPIPRKRQYNSMSGGMIPLTFFIEINQEQAEAFTDAGFTGAYKVSEHISRFFGPMKSDGPGKKFFVAKNERPDGYIPINLLKILENSLEPLGVLKRYKAAKDAVAILVEANSPDAGNVHPKITVYSLASMFARTLSGHWNLENITPLLCEAFPDIAPADIELWTSEGINFE